MSETNRPSDRRETVVVKALPTDPICTRVSAGGQAGVGYYIHYRGDLASVLEVLVATAAAITELLESRPQG